MMPRMCERSQKSLYSQTDVLNTIFVTQFIYCLSYFWCPFNHFCYLVIFLTSPWDVVFQCDSNILSTDFWDFFNTSDSFLAESSFYTARNCILFYSLPGNFEHLLHICYNMCLTSESLRAFAFVIDIRLPTLLSFSRNFQVFHLNTISL